MKDGMKAKSWADLDREDVKIAVTLGTAPDRELTKRLTKAKIERFQNMDEAIAAFYSGRVDGASFYHPALVMQQARVKKGSLHPEPVVALADQRRHPPRGRQAVPRLPRQGVRQVLQERRDAEVLRGVPDVAQHRPGEGAADRQGAMEVGGRDARRGLRRVTHQPGSAASHATDNRERRKLRCNTVGFCRGWSHFDMLIVGLIGTVELALVSILLGVIVGFWSR
jgi:hypothetical protein